MNKTYLVTLPKPNYEGICDILISNNHVFIKNGIENEKVEIQMTKKIKEGYLAEITKIITPSKDRIKSECSYQECGGCCYNHMKYEAQCILKTSQIISMAKNQSIHVHSLIPAQNPRHYRNKCIYTFQKVKNQLRFGFYEENTHHVKDIPNCLNHDELTTKILNEIKKLVVQFKLDIYNEDKMSGIMRHVLIRRAFTTNQTLVCFVVSKEFKGQQNFVKALVSKVSEITTVVFNINARNTSVVLSQQEKVMYGKGFIVDKLCNHTYKLSANTFYQINHDQTELLYQKAIELCDLHPNDIVLDMYCGIGTIGMSLAHQVKEVIGVEINPRSIQDAINNAKMNHISNIHFISKDASVFMQEYARQNKKADVVILDPPRSGSDETFIQACVSMKPKKILYISCNPQTQLRDLQIFKKYQYTTKEMFLFDLFPYSSHVESVVLLSRK